METLGSARHPVIVKVNNEQKAIRVAEICEEYGFKYIVGLEYDEDLTDLKKAIQQRMTPANVYDPCPCGSGEKYKFCCAKKSSNSIFESHLHFLSIWGESVFLA